MPDRSHVTAADIGAEDGLAVRSEAPPLSNQASSLSVSKGNLVGYLYSFQVFFCWINS